MRVLITGITGFVGSYMADYCIGKGCEVYGLIRHRSSLKNIEHIVDKITLLEGNLLDLPSMYRVMNEVKPDRIFHLAAQSYVLYSWQAPQQTLNTNVLGTTNLLESVKNIAPAADVLIIGTSEEYGLVKSEELPIKETNELRPLSPYGISKVAADFLGWTYFRSYGLKIVRTRAFNHTGPRRGKEFVLPAFVRQVLRLRKGLTNSIKVGNLEAIRDFTDVRDIVKAYWLALEAGDKGEVYNVCTGSGRKIEDVLGNIAATVFGPDAKVKIERDELRMRPADVPVLVGDCTKFYRHTGWMPVITFNQTIRDLIEYEEQYV